MVGRFAFQQGQILPEIASGRLETIEQVVNVKLTDGCRYQCVILLFGPNVVKETRDGKISV